MFLKPIGCRYFNTQPNGATAAERFFEQPSDHLFEWLLAKTDCSPLPAQKRSALKELRIAA